MKYVFLTPAIGWVGGAQIYCRNKIKFCQRIGYETYLFYDKKREMNIADLEPFETDGLVEELAYYPQYYTEKKRREVLHKILEKINYNAKDEVIFESHAPSESTWGELLAQECHGRNFIFLLPETFQLNKTVMEFLKFKYQRNELACITDGVMQRLFQNYMPLKIEDCRSLSAECTNSVEDVEIPQKYENIGTHKVIGIIGRLQKEYVKVSVKGIVELARKHEEERFQVLVIGGSDDGNDFKSIRDSFAQCVNVECYLTGNIYPIPQGLVKRMNVCLAAAGCVTVARREGVPTIAVDSYAGMAIGVVGYNTSSTILSTERDDVRPVVEYLELALYTDFLKEHPYTPLKYTPDEHTMDKIFQKHIEFLKGFYKKKDYYGLIHIQATPKDLWKKIWISAFGIRGFDWAVEILSFGRK